MHWCVYIYLYVDTYSILSIFIHGMNNWVSVLSLATFEIKFDSSSIYSKLLAIGTLLLKIISFIYWFFLMFKITSLE